MSSNADNNTPKHSRPKWIPKWLNVPFLIFMGFVAALLFFNDNSYIKINEYSSEINSLKASIKANEDSAAMYEKKIQELNTDRATLEKIAREKYGMKKDYEEVYVTDIP